MSRTEVRIPDTYEVTATDDGDTMTRDTLDDLLDRSAPATRAVENASLTTMIRAARAEARPRRRRMPRVALGVGLAAVLIGGTGVAVATDGFNWGPWLTDPIGEYSLTLPSGLECSVRIAHYTAADGVVAADVNRIVEDWWRATDVVADAEKLVPSQIAQIRAAESTVSDEKGNSEPGGYGTTWYDADWEYHWAFSMAIGELEQDVLEQRGYTTGDFAAAGLEGGFGIKCLDENGEVTIP